MFPECYQELVGLLLLSMALLISLCLNLFFYITRRTCLCTDKDNCCYPHSYQGEGLSQDESHYFHDLNHREQQENPNNHHEQQENPIYGNISRERGDPEVCYEMMTIHRKRDHLKPLEADLNYASLDLKLAKKHKNKHRHQQDQAQGHSNSQDQLPVQLTPPMTSFLGVEEDTDAQLPSRDTSTMVSQSSIYLNSQQIVQETEEMERERAMNTKSNNMIWEGITKKDGENKEWTGENEGEERKDRQRVGNGTACTQLSDKPFIQSSIDPFVSSLTHDSNQKD